MAGERDAVVVWDAMAIESFRRRKSWCFSTSVSGVGGVRSMVLFRRVSARDFFRENHRREFLCRESERVERSREASSLAPHH